MVFILFENSVAKTDIAGGGVNPLLWPIEPRGFTRNGESPLLIPCSGPIYNLSLHLNLPGFYLYIYKYYLGDILRKALVVYVYYII